MNNINIILTVYRRKDFFEKQIRSLIKQTCKNKIHLHIISNNKDIDFYSSVKKYFKMLNINFIQKNNELKNFARHKFIYENNFDYVIILDDDFLLEKNSIENLFNKKKQKTYLTFFGRNFKNRSDVKKLYSLNKPSPAFTNYDFFNYGGTGFSIIDCSIYKHLFEKYYSFDDNLKNIIHNLDDIFLSWIINCKQDWSIKNSNIIPLNFPNIDEHSSFISTWNDKDILSYELHKISNWKNV
jgi:glycosyltransferase involved in cell wall biosynthesis